MAYSRIAVLVVEDEALVRMGIVDFLEDHHFEVFEADNADAAIRILKSTVRICAMFTDVDMPGDVDGLEFAATVRDRWPPINIIVTSGRRRFALGDLPVEARFFAKPYEPDEIATTVRHMTGSPLH
ncbi:MAG: response regulator [Kaiparowitsia implicata GSE-PSE-MK54-09C]|jgi:CheY-like chemotaxis protein|nr:response regulator [Kaiparowitsia implicata GSE-PSE-MK54-09C]